MQFTKTRKKWGWTLMLSLIVSLIGGSGMAVAEHNAVSLHTAYTEVTVPPGESIRYSVDVMNHTASEQEINVKVQSAPEDWEYELTSGGWDVQKISLQPGDSRTFNFNVDVPLQVNRGSYRFVLQANNDTLPIIFNVAEKGTFRTEWKADQLNLEGDASTRFNFNTTLENRTADKQSYGLRADAPRGWTVQFKDGADRVSSVSVEPNASKSVAVDVIPPPEVPAGEYAIPILAGNQTTSAEQQLEVVISGTYGLELTTPEGLLSADITAGEERKLQLEVKNTGTIELTDISLRSATPNEWSVEFSPKEIDNLKSGESKIVDAVIQAADKALPGDYVTNITASSPEANSSKTFRITVEGSTLWGWIGVAIIAAVLIGIYYLFRTYGRR